jgi:hypothetical protein
MNLQISAVVVLAAYVEVQAQETDLLVTTAS